MNPGKLWPLEKVQENPQVSETCVLGLWQGLEMSLACGQRQ